MNKFSQIFVPLEGYFSTQIVFSRCFSVGLRTYALPHTSSTSREHVFLLRMAITRFCLLCVIKLASRACGKTMRVTGLWVGAEQEKKKEKKES